VFLRIFYTIVTGVVLFKGLDNIMAGIWLGILLYLPAGIPARLTVLILKKPLGLQEPKPQPKSTRRPLP
jgi:hypothetical protein